ncbi:MAG: hypothetical protein Q8R36_03855 [bacterium]|nr:hypothetical protein [bacterium]
MNKGSNVVQAEFFHVGGKNATSLEALFDECGERAADDYELMLCGVEACSQIKTVVRFFDYSGSVTAFARKFERTKQQDKDVLAAFVGANSFRRRWLGFRSRRLAGRILNLKGQGIYLAAQGLEAVTQIPNNIAVECADHSFRLARKDEIHELCESAHRAVGVWLFIFESNNYLFADKEKLIASVM